MVPEFSKAKTLPSEAFGSKVSKECILHTLLNNAPCEKPTARTTIKLSKNTWDIHNASQNGMPEIDLIIRQKNMLACKESENNT